MKINKFIKNKLLSILLIILSFNLISCATKTSFNPPEFDDLKQKIKNINKYFYKGEIFIYTPTSMSVVVYLRKDLKDEEVTIINDYIIDYVKSKGFKNFLYHCEDIIYDSNFSITITIETPNNTFSCSSERRSDFNRWYY